jgi:hypothetical protein
MASAAERPGLAGELAPALGRWLPDDPLALAWPPPELPVWPVWPAALPQPATQARPAAHSSQAVGILLTVPPERPPGPFRGARR